MTTEEVIHVYENSRLVTESFTEEAATAAYIEGLAALRAQQERKNPKPLTLDELREMDGEPVFLITRDLVSGEQLAAWWAILVEDNEIYFFVARRVREFTARNYGKTWLAYRHKPERD